MTKVEWTSKALDLLDGLDIEAQERLVKKLDEAKDWTSHRLEKLTGYPYYKLRAGDYRATTGSNAVSTTSSTSRRFPSSPMRALFQRESR
ncbi:MULTISPECIES: hypothetical protein [Halobacterium]|uniref:Vng6191h n=3 Tax=Halobacterium salinarum TaxID=2242 RepID=Q9HHW9_HALSA|nr:MULTISPECIES: hypothetical protein [Halobacterium]AAG20857.1 Vng6191h [Halobacterium salinarum NRC-1]MBB6090632.1 hypothetical protein [Halobacterium salinarum]MCF2208013.1 hypothetical protein [Halobacterium salinarum]MDL0119984.1 hypothetical protein [Halobacterium salinarum]MDL0122250.1 hypothetical protein [Halobacterium salinarum]